MVLGAGQWAAGRFQTPEPHGRQAGATPRPTPQPAHTPAHVRPPPLTACSHPCSPPLLPGRPHTHSPLPLSCLRHTQPLSVFPLNSPFSCSVCTLQTRVGSYRGPCTAPGAGDAAAPRAASTVLPAFCFPSQLPERTLSGTPPLHLGTLRSAQPSSALCTCFTTEEERTKHCLLEAVEGHVPVWAGVEEWGAGEF